MVGLSLVAVFAIAAITASSASALPEWGKCVAQAGGKYTNSNCTTKGKGGTFEWKKGATLKPVTFGGHSVGSGGVLYAQLWYCSGQEKIHRVTRAKCAEEGGEYTKEAGLEIECEVERNVGEVTGKNKIAHVHVKFSGCVVFGSLPCGNGSEEGEINTNVLKGSLGYINKSEKAVGVLLEPEKKHGQFASFHCGGEGLLAVGVGVGNSKEGAFYEPEKNGGYDGIISPIEPVNVMTSKYTQVFTINPETDENIPNKLDGKHISLLESYTEAEESSNSYLWGPAGEEITNENTSCKEGVTFEYTCQKGEEEEGEIKA